MYSKIGKPRMAVLFNKTLVSDFSDWSTATRQVLYTDNQYNEKLKSATGTVLVDSNRGLRDLALAEERSANFQNRGLIISSQERTTDSLRQIQPEPWMWDFENGFNEQFLKYGVRLVDRATIMRLTAHENQKIDDQFQELSAKNIEMKALYDKADMYIELLLSQQSKDLGSYQLRATLKEIKTGIIVADTVVTREELLKDSTYKPKKDESMAMCMGRFLAVRLAQVLGQRWNQN
jgi:hypothetical protein